MPYCTRSDVASLNKARVIGSGNNPTLDDVDVYISMTAAEIDSILVNKGYVVPVNVASSPETGALLNAINAKGAYWMMEEASPNSPNLDRARAAWEAAKKMLADAKFVLNAPQDVQRSEPRGPWVTFQPTGEVFDPMFSHPGAPPSPHNNPRNPYFSRQQRF